MKLIEQNPFRILGIAVNAGAKELAANMGKKKLLDIGKEVLFPLDMPNWLSGLSRTSSMLDKASSDINLPQDKIKYALFWFAQPSDPIGKLAYDHLLQGNTEKALELFGKSNSWESNLCLSTINLQLEHYANSLIAISELAENHCSDFCNAIAGQIYQCDSETLQQQFLQELTSDVDAYMLYDSAKRSVVSESIIEELKHLAEETSITSIEHSIAVAKAENKDDAPAQLKAGKKLMSDTKRPISQLKKMSGSSTSQVSRICDKLAGQIFQCSVNYHNAIDNATDEPVNRAVLEDCLLLAQYAQSIATGKLTHDRIQEGIDTLEEKKSKLPPEGLEKHDANIKAKILELVLLKGRTIDNAIQMMKDCASDIVTIKEQASIHKTYYLGISTQVVSAALSCVIDEYNNVTEKISEQLGNSYTRDSAIRSLKSILNKAWTATLMMDKFDVDEDFKNNRYMSNRKALGEMYDNVFGTSIWSPKPAWISNDEFDLRTEEEVFKDCRTAANFKDYTNKYPNGKHIEEARQRYQQLHIEEEKKRKEKEDRERKEREEREKEDRIFNACTSKSDYKNYLALYPNGRHKTEAEHKINGNSDGPDGCLIATIAIGIIGGIILGVVVESFWGFVIANVIVWSAFLKNS